MSYKAGTNYTEQGGATSVDAGTRNVTGTLQLSGVAVTSTAAELNLVDNQAADVTFAYAAGAANVAEVTMTVVDAAGTAIAAGFTLTVWLSDAATGVGLTATDASGTVQAKSASGADFAVLTAKKAIIVQTLATGIYILEITDTAKTTFYPAATVPGTGATAVGAIMATGDYGA